MTIQAISADGVAHAFPDGTDPAVIGKVMKDYSASQTADPTISGDIKGGLHDLGTATSQGLKSVGGVMARNGMPEYGGDVSSAGDFVQAHTPDAPPGDSPATQLGGAIRQGNYSAIPGLALHSALRAVPSVAPILGAAAVGGPVAAGLTAGGLALGPAAYGRAANNGRPEPTTGDVVGALPDAAVQGVAGAYMPGGSAAKIASPVLRSAARTGIMAGTAGGMEAANEVGTTLGTDKGLSVDPAQIAGAALTGGAVGAAREVPALGKGAVQAGSDRLMAKTLTPPTDVDAAASNQRSVGLMDAAKADTSNNQGKPLTDIQAANQAKSVLVGNIKDGIIALRNEQMLTAVEGSSLLRAIQAEALRHNNSASPELFDRIDGLDSVPEAARKALRDQVMDLNTLSTQSFAKNTTGPIEKVGNAVGRIGGVAAGFASGSPLLMAESVLGSGVNAKVGGAIGRMGDTALGLSQPTIRLQNINALKMLKAAGIDPNSITPTPSVADILDGARTPPPTPPPPVGGMQGPITAAPSVGATLAKAQALDPTTGNAPDAVPVNTPLTAAGTPKLQIPTPEDVRMQVAQDDARAPHDISGNFTFIHGHDPSNGPLTAFRPSGAGMVRYDDGNGVFGPHGVYMAENGKWVSGENGSIGGFDPHEVAANFRKALLLTPETEESVIKKFGSSTEEIAAKSAKAGYDGIIVRGFDAINNDSLLGDLQDQVFAMKPTSLKVNRQMDDREIPEITPDLAPLRARARARIAANAPVAPPQAPVAAPAYPPEGAGIWTPGHNMIAANNSLTTLAMIHAAAAKAEAANTIPPGTTEALLNGTGGRLSPAQAATIRKAGGLQAGPARAPTTADGESDVIRAAKIKVAGDAYHAKVENAAMANPSMADAYRQIAQVHAPGGTKADTARAKAAFAETHYPGVQFPDWLMKQGT